jgi:tRNA(adenine34) deaminase
MPAAKSAKPKRWSASVDTDSTHPPEGLFNKSASVIARTLASRRVSPKGPGSGMRMLTFYINRAGHNLTASRKAELAGEDTALQEDRNREEKEDKYEQETRGRLGLLDASAGGNFGLGRMRMFGDRRPVRRLFP